MKVLLTGHRGFIGSALHATLDAERHEVIGVDVREHADFDVRNASTMRGVIRAFAPDVVCHLAARSGVAACRADPHAAVTTNVLGAEVLARVAATCGVPRFVFASSCAVYGGGIRCTEDTPWAPPVGLYGATKRAAEHLVRTHYPEAACLRYANVYGPTMRRHGKDSVVARFLDAPEPLPVHRAPGVIAGAAVRDFIHLDDVVRATQAACAGTITGPCNVSTGRGVSISELATLLRREWAFVEEVASGPAISTADPHRLETACGFRPRAIEEGLRPWVG